MLPAEEVEEICLFLKGDEEKNTAAKRYLKDAVDEIQELLEEDMIKSAVVEHEAICRGHFNTAPETIERVRVLENQLKLWRNLLGEDDTMIEPMQKEAPNSELEIIDLFRNALRRDVNGEEKLSVSARTAIARYIQTGQEAESQR